MPHDRLVSSVTPCVLVVDDEPTPRARTCRMIRALGYRVHAAASGAEALRYLYQHRGEVNAVVAELTMAEMDGGELAERVRDQSPLVRVVLTCGPSGEAAGELRQGYPELPVLRKPVSHAELYSTLVQAVGTPHQPAHRPAAAPRRPSRPGSRPSLR